MYDRAKADLAVNFIKNLKHTKGQWRGVNFTLLDWQEQIIRDIFGTVKANGYRQYNTAYIEVPKKNGKSEIAAAVALLLLFADNEPGAEIYSAAADRMQASIVFNVAASMVRMSPALEKRCKIIDSIKRIVVPGTESFYQVLSAEAFTKHGLNVHGVIFDELHAQPNRELFDVLTEGSGDARTQPLYFLITTAGDDPDRTSIGWEVHETARKVIDGITEDLTLYPVIYGIKEDDDWTDEENWKKANPSLGHIIDVEKVRAAVQKAKDNPAKERLFRQLRLNQWVKYKNTKWASLEKWDATAGLVVPEELEGRDCYGGLDLSNKLDTASDILLFPPIETDPNWYLLHTCWIPEDNIKERIKRDGVHYDKWVKQGFIKTTPGNVIDYDFIKKTIKAQRDRYNIIELGYDPWNAYQTAIDLTDDGITVAEVRQGFKSMSPPMKELEALINSQRLKHGGNPVLRWMFGNLEVKMDENENVRPVKGKSVERIDGFVALVIAMARAMLHENKKSVYEQRGMRSL